MKNEENKDFFLKKIQIFWEKTIRKKFNSTKKFQIEIKKSNLGKKQLEKNQFNKKNFKLKIKKSNSIERFFIFFLLENIIFSN